MKYVYKVAERMQLVFKYQPRFMESENKSLLQDSLPGQPDHLCYMCKKSRGHRGRKCQGDKVQFGGNNVMDRS